MRKFLIGFLFFFSFLGCNKFYRIPPGEVIQEERKIKRRFIVPYEQKEVVTTKDDVAVWSYPGKSVIANVDKGTKLRVIDASKKWYIKVLLPDGRQGWICAFFVE